MLTWKQGRKNTHTKKTYAITSLPFYCIPLAKVAINLSLSARPEEHPKERRKRRKKKKRKRENVVQYE